MIPTSQATRGEGEGSSLWPGLGKEADRTGCRPPRPRHRPPALTHPASARLPRPLRFQDAASAEEIPRQAQPARRRGSGLATGKHQRRASAGESTIFKTVAQPIPPKFVRAVTKLQTNHVTGHRTPVIYWLSVLSICGKRP